MSEERRREPLGQLRLRAAMRSVAGPSAVIEQVGPGWRIELSDGRSCTFARERGRSDDELLSAAVHWARRHGAASIDVRTPGRNSKPRRL